MNIAELYETINKDNLKKTIESFVQSSNAWVLLSLNDNTAILEHKKNKTKLKIQK